MLTLLFNESSSSAAESAATSDSYTGHATFVVSVAESAAIADSPSATAVMHDGVAESSATSDA